MGTSRRDFLKTLGGVALLISSFLFAVLVFGGKFRIFFGIHVFQRFAHIVDDAFCALVVAKDSAARFIDAEDISLSQDVSSAFCADIAGAFRSWVFGAFMKFIDVAVPGD